MSFSALMSATLDFLAYAYVFLFRFAPRFFQLDADLSCECLIVFDIFLSFLRRVMCFFFFFFSFSSLVCSWYLFFSLVCLLALVASFILCISPSHKRDVPVPRHSHTHTDTRMHTVVQQRTLSLHYILMVSEVEMMFTVVFGMETWKQ